MLHPRVKRVELRVTEEGNGEARFMALCLLVIVLHFLAIVAERVHCEFPTFAAIEGVWIEELALIQ